LSVNESIEQYQLILDTLRDLIRDVISHCVTVVEAMLWANKV